jgi:tetratricopeptide (TPR) repeat protein
MTKEELREDPVLEAVQGFLSFMQRHGRWVALGAAAIAVIVVGVIMLQRSSQRAEAEASAQLAIGQSYFVQGNYAESESQLRELLSSHGGTRSGRAARIYLGDALLAQGRNEEALEAYEEALSKVGSGELQVAAQRGEAATLESLGRYAEASVAYERAADHHSPLEGDDLVAAGRSALRASDAARAQVILERARDLGIRSIETQINFYLSQAQLAQKE